jgi:hypothetical protein
MTDERLHEALVAVGKASPNAPPETLKSNLLAEFRRVHRVALIRRRVIQWGALAAAAAILLAVFVTARTPPAPPKQAQPAAKAVGQAFSLPAVQAPKPYKVHHRAAKAKPRPAPVEEAPEVATDFFAIPYVEPLRPEERANVFRMEIPRANIAAFGLPVSGGRLDSSVTADVVIGEDGVMRAIRFVGKGRSK